MERVFQNILNSEKDAQNNLRNVLKCSCQINGIPFQTFSKITAKQIQKNLKYLKKANQQKSKIWIQNQLIIFRCVIVFYSWQRHILIENFTMQEWILLSEMFRNKQIYILQYEAKNLLMIGSNTRRSWTTDQETILIELKNLFGQQNRWNQIARMLYYKSNFQYFRLGKHCRQHWLTYLDPKILNCTLIQKNKLSSIDKKVLSLLLKYGKKWTLISQELDLKNSPSQLKNKYNSFLKNVQNDHKLETVNEAIEYILKNFYEFQEKTQIIDEISDEKSEKDSECKTNKLSQDQQIENNIIIPQTQIKKQFQFSKFSAFKKFQSQKQSLNTFEQNYETGLFSYFYYQWLNIQMMNYNQKIFQASFYPGIIKIEQNNNSLFKPLILVKR